MFSLYYFSSKLNLPFFRKTIHAEAHYRFCHTTNHYSALTVLKRKRHVKRIESKYIFRINKAIK